MKAVGIVTKIENGVATVLCQRSSACSSCHECEAKGACHAELIFGNQEQTVTAEAENSLGAKIGDKVEIESSTVNTLLSAFFVFVIPFFVSLLIYFTVKEKLSDNTFFPLILIAVFLLAFYVSGKIVNAFIKKRHKTYIVEILEESKERFEAE